MLSAYPACFYKEENGYSVIFPDLNNLATCGEDLNQALYMAADCLAGYLHELKMNKQPFPAASKMNDIVFDNDFEYEECFKSMVSVDADEYARLHFNKSVKKTLSIPAWLNERAVAEHINFSQTLQEALIERLNL